VFTLKISKRSVNVLCGKNAKLIIVEEGGTYTYHSSLKGYLNNFMWGVFAKTEGEERVKKVK
jgi:hypothetical protein